MASIVDSLKLGQTLTCTVTKLPASEADGKTIARLMRADRGNAKSLKRAQRLRGQRLNVYNRGNRDWTSREEPAKVVYVAPGQAWTMTYTLDRAADLKKVEKCISIKAK
jgi:hypothetical protein